MDEDKYIKFLVDTVKDGNCRSGEVILNEKDLNSIGESLVKSLNEEIENGDFKLSGNISKIKGGLLIKSGSAIWQQKLQLYFLMIREILHGIKK